MSARKELPRSITRYYREGQSIQSIADKYGVVRYAVRERLKDFGVEILT